MKQTDIRSFFAKKPTAAPPAPRTTEPSPTASGANQESPTAAARGTEESPRTGDAFKRKREDASITDMMDETALVSKEELPPQVAERREGTTTATASAITIPSPAAKEADDQPSKKGGPFKGPTTMAKLFQASDWDPYTVEKWPKVASGQPEQPTPYAYFADVCSDISAIGSRNECTKMLTHFFVAIMTRKPDDLLSAVYLATNRQGPAHEGIELGIGDATLVKAVAESCGLTEKRCKELYQQSGDLPEVAQENKQRQATLIKPKPLSMNHVFQSLRKIASMSGKDVVRRRLDIIKTLIRDAKGPEVNFVVRSLQGKMRIGLAEPTVVVALGYAFAIHNMGILEAADATPEELQQAMVEGSAELAAIYHQVPSWDIVIPSILKHGYDILRPESEIAQANKADLSIRPGLPVRPQLAHPTNGITAVLDRFEGKEFTCEYKYDGERAQIHYDSKTGYSIYSRNSETHTTKYPDIIKMMPTTFSDNVQSFIIDSEVVAIDNKTGELQAFQVLQHRGRKNINIEDVTIRVCVFAFDLLYLNGTPLLPLSLSQRRELLFNNFAVGEEFRFATHLNSSEVDEIQAFLDQSVKDGCEGLMVKTLADEAEYTPNKRSHYWLKLKKDYMDGVTDTVDLVPIGAYHGKGKRTGVFGGFLMACYNPEAEEYQSICKIGTGFEDNDLETLTAALTPLVATSQPPYYRTHSNHTPDVWFTEGMVWEIKAADLTISPVHFAGIGLAHESKGIALRFPRFLKIREDKGPTDATSASQIVDMYKQQALALAQKDDMAEDE